MALSLTDDNAVLAQKAGAVFTVNSAMLYKCSIQTEIVLVNCLFRTIASLKFLAGRTHRRQNFA